MLAVRNVSLTTGPPRHREIFSGATLEVPRGSHTVVYGENGAGKSSLVRLFLGRAEADSGEVSGGALAACYFEDVDAQLFFSTVKEEIESTPLNDPEIESCLTDGLSGKSVLELSYSEKARVALYAACMLGREYLIVDSPPADEKIDAALEIIAHRGGCTLLLLLPEGEKRNLPPGCEEYVIRNLKFEKI